MLIFIDESGNIGQRRGATRHFALAMAVFQTNTHAKVTDDAIKRLLTDGTHKKPEFKFSHCSDQAKMVFYDKVIIPHHFAIRSVIWDQKNPLPPTALQHSSISAKAYEVMLARLLSTYPLSNAKILIDETNIPKGRKILSHIKRTTNQKTPNAIKSLKMVDSKKDRLIQLTDMTVGGIFRSVERNDHQWRNKLKLSPQHIQWI